MADERLIADAVADVYYRTPYKVRLPKWANDPCWRCGSDVTEHPVRHVDWLMQTVMCNACNQEQTRAWCRALGESMNRFIERRSDGTAAHD